MSYLESLFTKYGTDKGIWGYTPYYEEVMEKKRFDVRSVLEIGICGFRDIPNNVVGASLFVWRDYFPNAHIFGIDNDSRFIFNDQPRIHTALCDAYDRLGLYTALSGFNIPGQEAFDMIVDDAVHDPQPQLQLANSLMPFLKKGAPYFVEEACPYKMTDGMSLERFFGIGLTRPAAHIALCVTPKPEELAIFIK